MRKSISRFAGLARRHARTATLLFGAAVVGGCTNVLDVENPNNAPEESLEQPTAAPALVIGSAASITRALTAIYAP